MLKPIFLLLLLGALFSSNACKQTGNMKSGGTKDTLASIKNIELLNNGAFPVNIKVNIKGLLPDTCTKFNRISQDKKDNTFLIWLITTPKPKGLKCPGGEAPFEVEIPLQLQDLPKGRYEVSVNGVRKSFELEQGNWIEGE